MSQAIPTGVSASSVLTRLERLDRASAAPPATNVYGLIDALHLTRLTAIRPNGDALPWALHRAVTDAMVALHGATDGCTILFQSTGTELGIHWGAMGLQALERTQSLLCGLLPDASLTGVPRGRLGTELGRQGYYAHQGRIYGVPVVPATETDYDQYSIWDRAVDACGQHPWAVLVDATPVSADVLRAESDNVAVLSAELSQWAYQQTPGPNRTTSQRRGTLEERAFEGLQALQRRLELGSRLGAWNVEVLFFGPEAATLDVLGPILKGSLSGTQPGGGSEPVRAIRCNHSGTLPDPQTTLLVSTELALLLQPPQREHPGYAVRRAAAFLTDRTAVPPAGHVNLGPVRLSHSWAGTTYALRRDDLTKHVFISGSTGSGKTNTCMGMLEAIWAKSSGCPFLVIEPAKTEYRALAGVQAGGVAMFPQLRIHTLGSETVAPFRMNPFEFEITPGSGTAAVQRHVDLLKSVFSASFVLYAPMPYVLERCLHEIYTDRGWDLATGRNHRLSIAPEELADAFPTLTDLYQKIDGVVDSLGYDVRIQSDVKAALKTRIGSLRIGGKGLMLDTARSIPVSELLVRPTILELDALGDDEEKAFLMGLLLTRIYEHRRLQWHAGNASAGGLQHVTVIEEAHRLLAKAQATPEGDSANPRGKAVDTFASILAEVRAYGESVIVAEQTPSRIARDVIKNTATKIIHRMVDLEDRDLVGDSANLDDAQKATLATLDPSRGDALVFGERDDGAYRVAIPLTSGVSGRPRITDARVTSAMAAVTAHPMFSPMDLCNDFCSAARASRPCAYHIRDVARPLAERFDIEQATAAWCLGGLLDPTSFEEGHARFAALIQAQTGGQADSTAQTICVLIHASRAILQRKAQLYDWPIAPMRRIRDTWLRAATALAVLLSASSHGSLTDVAQQALRQAATQYIALCSRAEGPHAGCEACKSRCLYRAEAAQFLLDPAWQARLRAALATDDADELRRVCLRAAQQAVIGNAPVQSAAALCILVHYLSNTPMLPEHQLRYAVRLSSTLAGPVSQ